MREYRYRRDLPDGSRQYFFDGLKKPDDRQAYYDDMLSRVGGEDGSPLEFFAFGKEQSYPLRVLNRNSKQYILHYVTDGKGIFNGKSIGRGQGFLVLPDVPHHMESDRDDPWHFKWICFSGWDAKRQMQQIGLGEREQCFSFRFEERLEELFDELLYRTHEECELNTYMQGIFYMIMAYHRKEYMEQRKEREGYAEKIARYVERHLGEPIRAEELARELHLSRKHLCVVMEQTFGMTTRDYLLSIRLREAQRLLLHSEWSVSDIATEIGYRDYTQFSRMFHQRMGCSPQQYRKRGGILDR